MSLYIDTEWIPKYVMVKKNQSTKVIYSIYLLCKKEEIRKYTYNLIIPGRKTHRKDNSENDETGYLQSGVETGGKEKKKE